MDMFYRHELQSRKRRAPARGRPARQLAEALFCRKGKERGLGLRATPSAPSGSGHRADGGVSFVGDGSEFQNRAPLGRLRLRPGAAPSLSFGDYGSSPVENRASLNRRRHHYCFGCSPYMVSVKACRV